MYKNICIYCHDFVFRYLLALLRYCGTTKRRKLTSVSRSLYTLALKSIRQYKYILRDLFKYVRLGSPCFFELSGLHM